MNRRDSFPTSLPSPRRRWIALGSLLLAWSGVSPVAASSLETFVLAVGGRSNASTSGCTTFAVPSPVSTFFEVLGVAIPAAGLLPCGIEGDVDDQTAMIGPLSGNRSLGSAWETNSFSGSTATSVDYLTQSSQAHADYTGEYTSLHVVGAEGFGLMKDQLTVSAAAIADGQSGHIVLHLAVDGGLSTTGTGTAGVRVACRVDAGPTHSILQSSVDYSILLPSLFSEGGTGLENFTLAPGAMSGGGELTSAPIPIVFGTPFELSVGVFAYAAPVLTSVTDSNFLVTITGIEVRGPGGAVVADVGIDSSSGTSYDGSGVTAVGDPAPEDPGSALVAFPNPTRGDVQIRYSVQRSGWTSLKVYDAAGRLVRRLVDGDVGNGEHLVLWDGRDDRGTLVPNGIYFARRNGPGRGSTRITLVR